MEIILTKTDIESLIKEHYNGVNSVKFNTKNIKVTLDINIDKFMQKAKTVKTNIPITPPPKPKTLDELNQEAIQRGNMTAGRGNVRPLTRIG